MEPHVWLGIAFAVLTVLAYTFWALERLPRARHWLTFFAVVTFVLACVAQSYDTTAMVDAPETPATTASLP